MIDRHVRGGVRQVRSVPDWLPSPAFAAVTHDPVVVAGLRIYFAVLLGIVYLMTTKPHLTAALLVISSVIALGAAAGMPLWKGLRHEPADTPLTTAEM